LSSANFIHSYCLIPLSSVLRFPFNMTEF
jgi:hypothetical protein